VSPHRGSTALPAALAAIAVSAALAAAIAELSRTELALARRRAAAATALAAADACLAEVVAALPPAWDFGALLAGPDGIAGTPDDGATTAPSGCVASARSAPGPVAPARVIVRIQADAGGGRRRIDAVVGLDPAPGVPALVWLGRSPTEAIAGTVTLDGASDDPTAVDRAGFAAPDDPTLLDRWLAGQAGHVLPSARTADPITSAAPPFAALAARILAAGPRGSEVLVSGTPSPALAYVGGDLAVTDARAGAGVLFIDGRLDITGRLDFTGLVIATAGIHVAS